MTFLMIIFWIILIFYALRLVLRYLLPWLVHRYIRKVQRNRDAYNQHQQDQQTGEMKVKQGKTETPKIDPDAGEYVDFEEIKDNNNTQQHEPENN